MTQVKYTDRSTTMADPKKGIKVNVSNGVEADNLIELLHCSSIDKPTAAYQSSFGTMCVAAVEKAVRNGWAKNLAAANLALWQVPPTTIDRKPTDDPFNAALDLNQRITEVAVSADKNTSTVYLCAHGPNDCNKTPFNKEEIAYVIGASKGSPTAGMKPNRALAITPAHAALNGLFDAVMSPDNFRRTRQDGSEMSVSETLASIRKDNPKAANDAAFQQCLTNVGVAKQCAIEGARKGLGMVVDEGITYNGTKFVGKRASAASR